MTATSVPIAGPDQSWLDELGAFLGPYCFPAAHDQLAATLIRRHAPSRLLWHLCVLPRSRSFGSWDELVSFVRAGAVGAEPAGAVPS